MPEYEFSLSRDFLYKNIIVDFDLILENAGQRNPVFLHILRSEF